MKRKEREHLKEDPFVEFIERTLEKIRDYKKEILIATTIIVVFFITILTIVLINNHSIKKQNQILEKAMIINSKNDLTIDKKIEELKKIEYNSGIAQAIDLQIASLYFQKNDFDNSLKYINKIDSSNKLLFDQKRFLKAQILYSKGETQKAIEMLNLLVSESDSELNKDLLLYKLANYQIKQKLFDKAELNLKKIMTEFPYSFYRQKALELLSKIKK